MKHNWLVRVYGLNEEVIEEWTLKDRTEAEAERETSAEVGRIATAEDWTLTKIPQ